MQDELISVRDLLRILVRRRATILTATVVITSLSVLYNASRPPVYTATASVMIEPNIRGNQRSPVASVVDTQRGLITSPMFVEATMTELDLYAIDEYRAEPESSPSLIDRVEAWTRTSVNWPENDKPESSNLSNPPEAGESTDEWNARRHAENAFSKNLSVKHTGESLILNINFSARDPDRAAEVANHVAGLYLKHQLIEKQKVAEQTEQWLSAQVALMRERVLKAERELAELRSRHQFRFNDVAARSNSAVLYQELEREAEAKRAIYKETLSRYYDSMNSVELLMPDARLIAYANPPIKPDSLPNFLIAGVSLAASFIFGCSLALVHDRIDRRLWSGHQVEVMLRMPFLGLVPRRRSVSCRAQDGSVSIPEPFSAYGQAMQSVGLRIMATTPVPKVLLITSSAPVADSSLFAADLAVALRQTVAERVLLIDFDLWRPRVAGHFGLSAEAPGVMTLVSDRGEETGNDPSTEAATPESFIVRHANTGIDVLPSGPYATAGRMPLRGKIIELLKALRPQYDFVVVNAPPLLLAPEARVLATCIDSTVLVARWGRRKLDAADAGLALLRDIGAPVLGVVLSDANLRKVYPRANRYEVRNLETIRRRAAKTNRGKATR